MAYFGFTGLTKLMAMIFQIWNSDKILIYIFFIFFFNTTQNILNDTTKFILYLVQLTFVNLCFSARQTCYAAHLIDFESENHNPRISDLFLQFLKLELDCYSAHCRRKSFLLRTRVTFIAIEA